MTKDIVLMSTAYMILMSTDIVLMSTALLTLSLSKLHRQNLKNILFFATNKQYLETADKIK